MRRFAFVAGMTLLAALLLVSIASAQEIRNVGPNGFVLVPASSLPQPAHHMHTNMQIFVPNARPPFGSPPPNAETPASLGCVYKRTTQVSGCPIKGTTENPTGGWGAVAIVDAFDNPNAEEDLNTFSAQFGLPACTKDNGCFQQVYADGEQPANDPGGWSLEIALDIEMAHAMAPNAKIILVESKDNEDTSLYHAEDVASELVRKEGGGTITNSWSGDEDKSELQNDVHFQAFGIVYFASTGDSGAPVGYPAASPFVVAAGGTTLIRSNGNFTNETGWNGSGGGPSQFEHRPPYQDLLRNVIGHKRGTPDFSADANPITGPAMYDKDGNLFWLQIGGTSVSSPLLAGMVNADGYKAISTPQELTGVYRYADRHFNRLWRDIVTGNNGYAAGPGYDFVTGIGAPITALGK